MTLFILYSNFGSTPSVQKTNPGVFNQPATKAGSTQYLFSRRELHFSSSPDIMGAVLERVVDEITHAWPDGQIKSQAK